MNAINSHIAKNIVEFRKASNLTQEQLAGLLTLKRVSVTNMENGRTSFQPKTIYLLACIFGKEVSEFFPAIQKVEIKKQVRTSTVTAKNLPKI